MAIYSGFITFLSAAIIMCAFSHVAKTLHNKYLNILFNAPVNLFYDVTPLGKILNRFSTDLAAIDENLQMAFCNLAIGMYIILSVLIVTVIASLWMIIAVAIFLSVAIKLFTYVLEAQKETQRIATVSKMHLVAHLNETIDGRCEIRAYMREVEYLEKARELCDRVHLTNQMASGVSSWYNHRVSLLAIGMMTTACAACILLRG